MKTIITWLKWLLFLYLHPSLHLAELPTVSSNMSPPATRRSKSGVISLYPVLMNLKLAVCKVLVSKWVFMSILNLISVSKVSVNYGIGGTLILRYVVE